MLKKVLESSQRQITHLGKASTNTFGIPSHHTEGFTRQSIRYGR